MTKILAITLMLVANFGFKICAEAAGPDHFRVKENIGFETAIIYQMPSLCSQKIGALPSGSGKIKNNGCKGELSYDAWILASPKEREEARKRTWCEIEYQGKRGWVKGNLLTEDTD